jgi:hypothetical protein
LSAEREPLRERFERNRWKVRSRCIKVELRGGGASLAQSSYFDVGEVETFQKSARFENDRRRMW